MHDPVTIAPWTGTDGYGKPTYGPAVTYQGRIQREFQTLASTTGAQLVEETKVFLDETAVVDERSQVTIEGRIIPIEGLKQVQDEAGNLDHTVLYL